MNAEANKETTMNTMNAENTITLPDLSDFPELRRTQIAEAIAAGADQATIDTIVAADRVARFRTMILPEGRYSHCSRRKGWCRCGTGASATWGERAEKGGWRVGPGRWTILSSDGFRREQRTTWTVRAVTVGDATWTVAS